MIVCSRWAMVMTQLDPNSSRIATWIFLSVSKSILRPWMSKLVMYLVTDVCLPRSGLVHDDYACLSQEGSCKRNQLSLSMAIIWSPRSNDAFKCDYIFLGAAIKGRLLRRPLWARRWCGVRINNRCWACRGRRGFNEVHPTEYIVARFVCVLLERVKVFSIERMSSW